MHALETIGLFVMTALAEIWAAICPIFGFDVDGRPGCSSPPSPA